MLRLLPFVLFAVLMLFPAVRGLRCATSPALWANDEMLEEPFLCDFKEEISFQQALKHISETTKLSFFLDHPALRDVNVTSETRVKFRLPFPLPLRDALDYLAKQTGTAWGVKDGIVTITSPKKANGELFMRTYYVGDLLGAVPIPNDQGIQPQADFGPLMDYIQTMVAPESWKDGGEIREYYPNLSLVVRQREEQHAEIAELLKRLRKYNDLQISFECEVLAASSGYKQTPRITCFNGRAGSFTFDGNEEKVVRIAPVSSEPIPEHLAAANEPFLILIPKGVTSITVKGVVRPGNVIKAIVIVEGQEPQTRLFHAAPIRQKEEEEPSLKTEPQL